MATTPRSAPAGLAAYLPRGRWLLVAGAFLLGWLLFAVVWLAARRDQAVATGPELPAAVPEEFEPLPRPAPATSLVVVSALVDPRFRIEIEAVAALGELSPWR